MTEVRGSQGPLVEPCTFFPVLLRQESLYIALAGPEGMSTGWPGLKFAAIFYVFFLSIRSVGMHHSSKLFCFFLFYSILCSGLY